MPRPGTKQVIRTTTRGPSQITRERRDAYREQLQGYMKSRTDLKAGAPQATPGPAPVPAYQAPAGGMGAKSPPNRAHRAAQARIHRAAIKKQKLGSPLSGPLAGYGQNMGAGTKQSAFANVRAGPVPAATRLPPDAPQYGDVPPINPGESDADYQGRYQAYYDAWHQQHPQGGQP